ncbi:Rrf2 family transcriptional regulator [Arthrobacter sp. I2-34]|uniref:Rrf2 family transcriptional regulator n=1 Tax=Arthrobacter hankyongi TaxID=2904801 RepID=A0ABS9L856_9MICC|nr:Rrf2 family transcriptional regulator [Arthrobacter hankyongi]MCG2622868.1 Rrf2 family transcriptional regulator [Arthrobacter hankyongi]
MRINAFSDVCLRALMLLCAAPEGELFTTQAIADGVGTPYNHVSKAVLKLRSLGLVEAVRGRAGGVRISQAGMAVTVGALLRELDGREDLVDCESPNGDCPMNNHCGLRGALRRAREAFYHELDDLVVSSLPHQSQMEPVFVTLLTRRPA